MPKAGYISVRMSLGRVYALDAIRTALRYNAPTPANADGVRLTDQQCIDFALDWLLASLPERLTPRQAETVIRRMQRHGWLTQSDDRITPAAFDVDMTALAERVKESHASEPADETGNEGHAFQQQDGNGCELCGLDRDTHPLPF